MRKLLLKTRGTGVCVCASWFGEFPLEKKKEEPLSVVTVFVSGLFINSKVVRKSYVTRGPKNSGKALNAIARDIATFFLENNYRIAKAGISFWHIFFFYSSPCQPSIQCLPWQ